MKKILTLTLVGAILVFGGCSVMDIAVDEVEVHNGLIQKLDGVLVAEENFYNEYWALEDGSDTTLFVESYDNFKTSVDDLDAYFENTRFASGQQVFVEDYNDYYKPFVYGYVAYAGEFTDKVLAEGFTYDAMVDYFDKLDGYTIDFVEIHNKLIGTVNIQSDYASTGQVY